MKDQQVKLVDPEVKLKNETDLVMIIGKMDEIVNDARRNLLKAKHFDECLGLRELDD